MVVQSLGSESASGLIFFLFQCGQADSAMCEYRGSTRSLATWIEAQVYLDCIYLLAAPS